MSERESMSITRSDIANVMSEIFGTKQKKYRKKSAIFWNVPKGWTGTTYLFGYTPWRTMLDGKEGYLVLKYRKLKNGTIKLRKAVRFSRRKVAKARSLKWWHDFYDKKEEE